MKKFISILLAVCILAACFPAAGAVFSDVRSEDTALAVNTLYGMGVVSGFEDGSFRPSESLTRAQFCTLVISLLGKSGETDSAARSNLFSDVKSSDWFAGYVNLASQEGLVKGKGNGRFAPNDSISLGEAVTILIRMLGYTSAQVGPIWPRDYVNFAEKLGISEGVSAGMNEAVDRGEAARLIYNMLRIETSAGKSYYSTLGYEVSENVLLLSTSAKSMNGSEDSAMVYLSAKGELATYPQKSGLSPAMVGTMGTLLLNDSAVVGFIPDDDAAEMKEVEPIAKTSSSVTDRSGLTYNIPTSAKVVSSDGISTWSARWSGISSLCIFYKRGEVQFVYVPSESGSGAVVAQTESAYSEIFRKLGVSDAAIYKNGAPADTDDLVQYDVAYYDEVMNTVVVSDRKISGYISNVYPNMSGAETITVFGSTYTLLDSARKDAASFKLGDKVTLLLTDDLKVAAIYPASKVTADMIGLSAQNGRSAVLPGGISVSASDVSTNVNIANYGKVVTLRESAKGVVTIEALGSSSVTGDLSITKGTIGSYELAPGAVFYDCAGGFAVEISLADITWTKSVSRTKISYAHLNSAGKVDIVIFDDLTGSCYEYGFAVFSTKNETSYITVENGQNGNFNGVGGTSVNEGTAVGIAGRGDGRVISTIELTRAGNLSVDAFYSTELMLVKNNEIAISEDVKIYNTITESWTTSLEDAIAFCGTYTAYYDKTPTTGGQVRIIVIED